LVKPVKYLLTLFFLLSGISAHAQKVTGVVTDKATKQPIIGAIVKAETATTRTNQLGQFEIILPHLADSLKITAVGYKALFVAAGKPNILLNVELEPKINNLNEVTVRGDRSFKKDSLANRADFARQFNYKGPRVIDAFTGNGLNFYPGEFLSVNLLVLVQALTKKSTPEYKFNKILIRDEHEQFVDEKFNRGNVSRITGLNGDTLSVFLALYRPTYEMALKSTDYDMEVYIRGRFSRFKDDGFKSAGLVLDKSTGVVKLN
jgi:hypothetical protein